MDANGVDGTRERDMDAWRHRGFSSPHLESRLGLAWPTRRQAQASTRQEWPAEDAARVCGWLGGAERSGRCRRGKRKRHGREDEQGASAAGRRPPRIVAERGSAAQTAKRRAGRDDAAAQRKGKSRAGGAWRPRGGERGTEGAPDVQGPPVSDSG